VKLKGCSKEIDIQNTVQNLIKPCSLLVCS